MITTQPPSLLNKERDQGGGLETGSKRLFDTTTRLLLPDGSGRGINGVGQGIY